jgi:hypothetical protein
MNREQRKYELYLSQQDVWYCRLTMIERMFEPIFTGTGTERQWAMDDADRLLEEYEDRLGEVFDDLKR